MQSPIHRAVTKTLAAAGMLAAAPALYAQAIPAFPGADGAGAFATGARGGIVYHVTKLDTKFSDVSSGTLRYGLTDANFKDAAGNVLPRTIVFDVGGTIWMGRNTADTEGWDTQDQLAIPSNVTIAGQTAPGGINILGGVIKANGSNAIIRNIVMAPGYGTRNTGTDGMPDSYVYDAMNIHGTNVIVDHVSAVFATDETISADEGANNITLQYSNISQGQDYPDWDSDATSGHYTGHALGSLWQPGSNAKTTIHHNLYAQQKGRLPRVGTEAGKLTTPGVGAVNDFRNNVVYNWLGAAGTGASGQPSSNNFVGNYFLAGNGGEDGAGTVNGSPQIVTTAGGTSIFDGASGPTGIYYAGNIKDINKNSTAEFSTALTNSDFGASTFASSPYSVPYFGVTDSAPNAYSRVLAYTGANWNSRNSIDARLVNEVMHGTGQITAWNDPTHGTEWNTLLGLRSTTNGGVGGTGSYLRPANFDTDQDGMPDVWEVAHGLDPAVADNNGDFDSDGYTNLEEYINELAEWPAPQPIVFTGTTNRRYEQITNWDIQWQPSKYDEAQINSGTATIDSVGQHARVLKIAANAGNAAALTVTGGWIQIEQDLKIGAAGSGQITQSGGLVSAGNSVVIGGGAGASGVYNLTGGTLSTPAIVNNGTFSFAGGSVDVGPIDGTGTTTVGAGRILVVDHLRQATLNVNGELKVRASGGSAAAPSIVDTLTIASTLNDWTGRIDLTDNDLILHSTAGNCAGRVATILNQLRQGANFSSNQPASFWTGNGMITSLGGDGSRSFGALGVIYNDAAQAGRSGPLYTAFDGQPVGVNDVLVKYTLFGDADLNGQVNSNDYFQIDSGFLMHRSGWINGDFDYDGVVTASDYFLIDSAFVHAAAGATLSANATAALTVPEPASLLVAAGAAGFALARRRGHGRGARSTSS